jgi:predicted metal-dependent hydrolase
MLGLDVFGLLPLMKTNQFIFDDLIIEVIRKPIKHMYLRIKPPDGQICISIPLRANLSLIRQQLEIKREWIHAQRARLKVPLNPAGIVSESNEFMSFLGKNYTPIINPANRRKPIALEDGVFYFAIGENASRSDIVRLINRWYHHQFQILLPPLITKWESIIPVRTATFTIRAMKTRWGSCNTRTGRICLNLNLMKHPIQCLEYVLVHEMVHLLEASHNKRFYALMTKFMPDWQTHHRHLNPNARMRQ